MSGMEEEEIMSDMEEGEEIQPSQPQTPAQPTSIGLPPNLTARYEPSILGIPRELRDMIWKLLLVSPEPIVIIPFSNEPLFADKPPYVAVLATCRQINEEGTKILYEDNRFIAGHTLLKGGNGKYIPVFDPYRFFPWSLRLSTLAMIKSITFVKVCLCADWADRIQHFVARGFVTDGKHFNDEKPPDTPGELSPPRDLADRWHKSVEDEFIRAGIALNGRCYKCIARYLNFRFWFRGSRIKRILPQFKKI